MLQVMRNHLLCSFTKLHIQINRTANTIKTYSFPRHLQLTFFDKGPCVGPLIRRTILDIPESQRWWNWLLRATVASPIGLVAKRSRITSDLLRPERIMSHLGVTMQVSIRFFGQNLYLGLGMRHDEFFDWHVTAANPDDQIVIFYLSINHFVANHVKAFRNSFNFQIR